MIHQLEFEMKLTSLSNHSVWHASCRIKSTHNRFLLAVASIGLLGNGLTLGYWSGVPFRLGAIDVVKYSATRLQTMRRVLCKEVTLNALQDEPDPVPRGR